MIMSVLGEIIAAKIKKIVKENNFVKSFYLEPVKPLKPPKPGQFFMVWVPGHEEIPISVSGWYPQEGLVRITVAARGATTKAMHRMRGEKFLGLKGPLGNYIEPEKGKRYLLVGGGYGVAPLIFFAQEAANLADISIAIGARTKDQLLFVEEARRLRAKVYVATDDGSMGFKGFVTDLVKELLARESFDTIIACGPEEMMLKTAKMALSNNIEVWIIGEEYMKCGIGLCGSCELKGSGIIVCRDGPVLPGRKYIEAIGVA